MTDLTHELAPGATIGIVGGGQLGRMLVLAAARLGFQCHIFTPEPDACALQVVQKSTVAPYTDMTALEAFARDCDVITYEFENVPIEAAEFLASVARLLPDADALRTAQDRLREKQFLQRLGIPTVPYRSIADRADLDAALDDLGTPAVLKTRRFGYDGKGQAVIRTREDAATAWRAVGRLPCVLEAFVDFDCEISVIVARSIDGKSLCFDVTENVHRDHILRTSHVPANIDARLDDQAREIATAIVDAVGYAGVAAVEMFVVTSGNDQRVLVNEIAPRVHNSGHWTLDGATISQFEQHIRAVAGWPLVTPVRHGAIRMENLIGVEAKGSIWKSSAAGMAIHWYGKTDVRPARKMGHATEILHG